MLVRHSLIISPTIAVIYLYPSDVLSGEACLCYWHKVAPTLALLNCDA